MDNPYAKKRFCFWRCCAAVWYKSCFRSEDYYYWFRIVAHTIQSKATAIVSSNVNKSLFSKTLRPVRWRANIILDSVQWER